MKSRALLYFFSEKNIPENPANAPAINSGEAILPDHHIAGKDSTIMGITFEKLSSPVLRELSIQNQAIKDENTIALSVIIATTKELSVDIKSYRYSLLMLP
jgi:hypothetical protein